MSEINQFSRRKFLKTGSIAGAGLLLSFHLPLWAKASGKTASATLFAPNAFISISADNAITILCNHSEMGQGTYTALTQLIADEMEADWDKVSVAPAPANTKLYACPAFGMQLTGGSASTYSEYERLRKVGASAKAMLIEAAAKTWSSDISSCRAENGYVIHTSGKKLSFGELVGKTEGIEPPKDADIKLKSTKDFKYIGKSIKRVEGLDKINGNAMFGMDVKLPGMLVAVVERAPVFGSKLKSFNGEKAKAVPGVKHVIQIDRGVAVVANGYWAAKKGREALEVEWDLGPLLDSKKQREEYLAMTTKPGMVAKKEGDVMTAAGATTSIEAIYELPYLNHAQMEPLNCTASVTADGCDIYLGTQAQSFEQGAAAKLLGIKPEQVRIHTQLLGGAFGRRAVPDAHTTMEAVEISKAIAGPVKVMWSREDDLKGGYYRPVSLHSIKGAIGKDQRPLSWQHRVVCRPFIFGEDPTVPKKEVDESSVEGLTDMPYAIPNLQIEWHQAMEQVPVLWMRSVGHSQNAYVKECFIDELAFAAGKDPYQFRRSLMDKHVRLRNVLDLAAKNSGWGKKLPPGHAMGIAVHESFKSFVAQVAEVSVSPSGKVKVHKVWVVIDCGPVINPDNVKAQMEGCVVFAMTSTLFGKISFENGRVQQSNFYDYRIARMNEVPVVEVEIIESTDSMGGVGEPGVPCTGPAIANAVFVLTKKRIRSLPFPVNVFKS